MSRLFSTPVAHKHQHELQNIQQNMQESFQKLMDPHPSLSMDQVFYQAATILYHEVLTKQRQINKTKSQINQLRSKLGIKSAQKRINNQSSHHIYQNEEEKKRRIRRTAVQITRHYTCTIDRCNKSYGSEGSLNQHLKIKHPNQYAKRVLLLEINQAKQTKQ